MENSDAIIRAASDLRVGLTAEFEREISEADVLAFAANCGDRNPLHLDAVYARSTNLGSRVVHGAFQVGLASAIAGMYLPGRNSFIASYNAQFNRPLFFPCRVAVQGEITAWDPENVRGSLRVIVSELPSRITCSQIHVNFTLHETAEKTLRPASQPRLAASADSPAVLITGASGGIGSHLTAELGREYAVLAVVHRQALQPDLASTPRILQLKVDLSETDSISQLEEMLADRQLYGIVHAAWPGLLTGGLLSVPRQSLEQQLSFGVFRTIELARLLASRVGSEGGRLVVLGSLAGTQKPSLNMAAYSLAKASLEHTVKLLAPELALKKITINSVCPSFLPVGINLRATERQRLVAQAAVPLGRLCDTADVLGAVRYLFSREASFLTGQTIVLSGGQV